MPLSCYHKLGVSCFVVSCEVLTAILFKIQVLWIFVNIFLWIWNYSSRICKIKFTHYWYFVQVNIFLLLVTWLSRVGLIWSRACIPEFFVWSHDFTVVGDHIGTLMQSRSIPESRWSWILPIKLVNTHRQYHTVSFFDKILSKINFFIFHLQGVGGPLACVAFQRNLTICVFIFLHFQSFYL